MKKFRAARVRACCPNRPPQALCRGEPRFFTRASRTLRNSASAGLAPAEHKISR